MVSASNIRYARYQGVSRRNRAGDKVRENEFGTFMKMLREAKGLTQDQAFEVSGVAQTTISGLETGAITRTSDANMAKLARAYGARRSTIYAKAGLIEPLDDVDSDETSSPSPLDEVIAILEADPEVGPQLAEIKQTQTPRVYREAVEALADAWRANAKMMLRTFRAGQEARSR